MRAPLTATHRRNRTGTYIRLTGGDCIEEYLHGKWFHRSEKCEDVLGSLRKDYAKLFKSGIALYVANARLALLGSKYRVPAEGFW